MGTREVRERPERRKLVAGGEGGGGVGDRETGSGPGPREKGGQGRQGSQ